MVQILKPALRPQVKEGLPLLRGNQNTQPRQTLKYLLRLMSREHGGNQPCLLLKPAYLGTAGAKVKEPGMKMAGEPREPLSISSLWRPPVKRK